MPISQDGNRIIHGVTFPPHFTDFHALLWLYRFAPRLTSDPAWRPTGAIDSNPSEIPYTGLGRFQHAKQIGQMLYPKAFEWHSWSDLIVEKACTTTSFGKPEGVAQAISNILAISGPGACLLGSSRIFNPITGKSPTIRSLCDAGIAPIVMTLYGPRRAGVPFRKGRAELIEVTLENGRRFTSTANHRVLTARGYIRVGSLSIGSRLFGYEQTLQSSISDNGPLTHGLDVRHSRKKVGDFQADYPPDLYSDDEQLLAAIGADRSFAPSRDDVPVRSRCVYSRADDLGRERKYTRPCSLIARPSNSDFWDQDFRKNGFEGCLPDPETLERNASSCEQFALFCQTTHRLLPSGELNHDVEHRQTACGVIEPKPCEFFDQTYALKVSEIPVASITNAGYHDFYDLTVPIAHHYFAEGAIHHNSGKSTAIGLHALEFWQCAPLDTAVIIASKTIESAKKRIWREVSRLYSIFSQVVGGYRDAQIGSSPRPFICPVIPSSRKKDEAHGLFVTALHGKELEKEIGYIKGFHPRRILVVADELDSLEEGGQALVDTFIDNLQTGTEEAQFIALGNDPSLFNALGAMMQPEMGKPVTLAHKEWTSATGATCLRLDAWDSPNLKDNNKWTGLVRQQDIDNITRNGVEMNSPSVWIQLHGLHPPEGADNTVLSEAAIIRFHCKEKVLWQGSFISSAALDPGFGGDPCVLRTFKRGNDATGNFRAFCDEIIIIPIDAGDKYKPAEYQISEKVIAVCKARSIPPDEFVIGGTGTGRGTPSVIQREWSPRIHICLEGGAPSNLPVSDEDPRPAKVLYDRRVTELWFSIRQFVEADILRGLDDKTALQLCSRKISKVGSGGNWKDSIEKKEEMAASPNEADTLGFYIDLLRTKGITAVVETQVKSHASEDFEREVREQDFDSGQTYQGELEDSVF